MLIKIEESIATLKQEAAQADLDPELKEFIHTQLHRLENGLALYHIKGAIGLKEATYLTLGEFASRSAEIDSDKTKFNYARRIWDIINDMHFAADTALKVKQIGEAAGPPLLALFGAS